MCGGEGGRDEAVGCGDGGDEVLVAFGDVENCAAAGDEEPSVRGEEGG